HWKRRDLALGHIVAPAFDELQGPVLLEDRGSGQCMLLVALPIGGRNRRNKPIDVGHDGSPSVRMVLAVICGFEARLTSSSPRMITRFAVQKSGRRSPIGYPAGTRDRALYSVCGRSSSSVIPARRSPSTRCA